MRRREALSRTLVYVIVAVIVILGIAAYALLFTQKPSPPQPTTTPITATTTPQQVAKTTITTTTPITTTTLTTTTPTMTTATLTTPSKVLVSVQIGNATIRVPKEFYDFIVAAKEGKISVTINYWTSMYPFEADIMKRVVDSFMKSYPGVKVNYQNVQNMKETIKAGIVAGDVENTAHVFTWAHDWTGEFADAGYIIALDKYLPAETLSDIQSQLLPLAFSAGQLGIHVYGLPWSAEAIALICDANKVPKIPSTFSQLEDIMKSYTNPSKGTYGIAYQIDPYHIYPFVTAFGGYYYDENKDTSAFNSTGTLEGIKFLLTHVFPYMYTADVGGETQLKIFLDGKAPCIVTGPWSVSRIKEVYKNVVVGPIPDIDNKVPRPFVGVKELWITSLVENDKNRLYASLLFTIWFVLNDDTLKIFVDEAGFIPVKNSLISYVEANKERYVYVYGFLGSVVRGVLMPKVPKMGCVWDPVGTAISAIVTMYSQQGLDATLKELKNILDSAAQTLATKCKVAIAS